MQHTTICATGHRPNKLWGYDLSNPNYIRLKDIFKRGLVKLNCNEAISGMALGVDTVFALAVLELKSEGYDIKLHCAIPCQNHSCKWTADSIVQYNQILEQADIVKIVTDAPYSPQLMQIRNAYMVDRADIVLAVWNGTPGGTANCIKYAQSKSKTIYNVLKGQS